MGEFLNSDDESSPNSTTTAAMVSSAAIKNDTPANYTDNTNVDTVTPAANTPTLTKNTNVDSSITASNTHTLNHNNVANFPLERFWTQIPQDQASSLQNKLNPSLGSSSLSTSIINDPIHGSFEVEGILLKVIDTPYVQRLRRLNQLGAASWVFPGAAHNRFQHSLGTMHLAGLMAEKIRQNDTSGELAITDRLILLVKLAGLCHDLGHGPFSHVFDGLFIKNIASTTQDEELRQKILDWTHEDASEMMLEASIEASGLKSTLLYSDPLTDMDVLFIKQLINPKRHDELHRKNPSHPFPVYPEYEFLYDIVSNSRCSIDVDKFDYLQRDAQNAGLKISFDTNRLINNCKVILNPDTGKYQICYDRKADWNIYELFHSRYTCFKQIYSHRKVKCVEYMISDALVLADSTLSISARIFDSETYLFLDDAILHEIKTFNIEKSTWLTPKQREDMIKAKHILRRLDYRELYRYCAESLLPANCDYNEVKKVDEDFIMRFIPPSSQLTKDDIIIQHLTLNYANKDKDPVKNIRFYRSKSDTGSKPVPSEKISLLIPKTFQERYVRIFIRPRDQVEVHLASRALNDALIEKLGAESGLASLDQHSDDLIVEEAATVNTFSTEMSDKDSNLHMMFSQHYQPVTTSPQPTSLQKKFIGILASTRGVQSTINHIQKGGELSESQSIAIIPSQLSLRFPPSSPNRNTVRIKTYSTPNSKAIAVKATPQTPLLGNPNILPMDGLDGESDVIMHSSVSSKLVDGQHLNDLNENKAAKIRPRNNADQDSQQSQLTNASQSIKRQKTSSQQVTLKDMNFTAKK